MRQKLRQSRMESLSASLALDATSQGSNTNQPANTYKIQEPTKFLSNETSDYT